jgi:predicted nucleic acid-binding protein
LIFVLDASIAVKWFIPDGDAGDAAAERILRDIAVRPAKYVVPELFMYELLSVLCRRFRQAGDAQRAIARLGRIGLRRVRMDERLARTAVRLAYRHRLTGYDAAYAALATEISATWLTLDKQAHQRLEALGISRLAMLPIKSN